MEELETDLYTYIALGREQVAVNLRHHLRRIVHESVIDSSYHLVQDRQGRLRDDHLAQAEVHALLAHRVRDSLAGPLF